ncbi:hypothetical protein [Paraferrimonas sp. SM1919]|uniref:hypothetical protein n=1 Tax=Paraferrimonas sp. SM1919 TaxID=2662263 RepID=UPI0013D3509F|nr:hypothetical protein [Paraferrimonas sp. SM1919]
MDHKEIKQLKQLKQELNQALLEAKQAKQKAKTEQQRALELQELAKEIINDNEQMMLSVVTGIQQGMEIANKLIADHMTEEQQIEYNKVIQLLFPDLLEALNHLGEHDQLH